MPNRVLDMSKCDDGDADEAYQLQIVSEEDSIEGNSKFSNRTDDALEDEIKKYKRYLDDLKSNKFDPHKLEIHIQKLLSEQRYRKMKPKQVALRAKRDPRAAKEDVGVNGDNRRSRATRASNFVSGSADCIFSKADCGGSRSSDYGTNVSMFSEEIEILNPSKGQRPFSKVSSSSDGFTLDGGKDKSRAYSGELAGPSARLGLRSSVKKQCNGRFSSTNASVGEDRDLSSLSCQKQSSTLFFPKDKSSKGNSPPGTPLRKKGNVGKRARQGLGGGGSPEKVVELFSSEDEEKESRDTFADCTVSNQRNVYGTRSSLAPSMEGVKIAYPSRDDPEAVEVLFHDLHRLEPLEFLNDTVIDFYIKYIQRPDALGVDHKNKFYFFNSFFYKKLSEVVSSQNKKQGADLSKLRKWTKGTNIFEKEYLFVPIHDKWHWSLAIVCHPGAVSEDTGSQRYILHLDSMSPGHKSNNIFRLLRSYLVAEWKHQADEDGVGNRYQKLNGDDFLAKKIPVPQQENESDCGLFLLHYIARFVKEAPSSFELGDVEQGKVFGRHWFKPGEASGLRRDIQQLLESIFKTEADKASETAAPLERFNTCQNREVESILQMYTQQVKDSGTEDERVKEVTEPVHSPVLCSAAEPVHEISVLDGCLANDFSLGSSTSETLQVGCEEKQLNSNLLTINEEPAACFSTICDEERNSSGLIGIRRSRSSEDLESCMEFGATNKHVRVGSVNDREEINTLHQLNSLDRDLDNVDHSGGCLVVELPIQTKRCSADKSLQVAAGVAADDIRELRLVDNGQVSEVSMDGCDQ